MTKTEVLVFLATLAVFVAIAALILLPDPVQETRSIMATTEYHIEAARHAALMR